MKIIISTALLVLIGLAIGPGADAMPLSGVIKSPSGKPIPKVKVLTYAPLERPTTSMGIPMGAQRFEVTSDEQGAFRLPDHGPIIWFTLGQQQRPVTKVLPLAATSLDVVMEDVAATLWKMPPCNATANEPRTGVAFKVTASNDVLVKKITRFGLDAFVYGYQMPDGKFASMANWQDATSFHPDETLMLNSREFSERVWVAGDRFGYDVRGVSAGGKLWRFVSYRWGAISYHDIAPAAARAFDKLVDEICFDEADAKIYPSTNF